MEEGKDRDGRNVKDGRKKGRKDGSTTTTTTTPITITPPPLSYAGRRTAEAVRGRVPAEPQYRQLSPGGARSRNLRVAPVRHRNNEQTNELAGAVQDGGYTKPLHGTGQNLLGCGQLGRYFIVLLCIRHLLYYSDVLVMLRLNCTVSLSSPPSYCVLRGIRPFPAYITYREFRRRYYGYCKARRRC